MSAPLAGRHALVTGAGQGIGAAIARALAADGATLTLLGRRRAPLEAVAAAIGGAHVVTGDVTDEASVAAAFEAARAANGPLAILVNNAGQAESAPFRRSDDALWRRMLDVNLMGTVRCTRLALPDLQQQPAGRVVNVASTAGQRGYAYVSAYAAAKHAVVGLTRSLALELARTTVTVNAVCPGFTETDMLEASIARIVTSTGRTADEARAELARTNPQGRLVTPDEVAAAVRWLCGDAARGVTGQCVSIAGGEVM